MPRPHKYSVASSNMATPYKGTRADGRGADLLKLIKDLPPVHESWGACRNTAKKIRRGSRRVPKCTAYKVILGNGLCMNCWDREIDSRANRAKYRNNRTTIPSNEDQ